MPRWILALGSTVIVVVALVTIVSLSGGDDRADPDPATATATAVPTPAPDSPVATPEATPDPPTATPRPTPPPTPDLPSSLGESAELVFADEFDGDELDLERWNTCHWWSPTGCTIASNNELEWYVADAVSVADGTLRLEARADPQTGFEGEQLPYASGMVTTGKYDDESPESKFSFTYGHAEIRARIPTGSGLWPAFWLLPETLSSKPEIDVLEVYGDSTDIMRMRLHWEEDNIGERHTGTDLADGWHTYAVDWRPGVITWYLDGAEVWTLEHPEVPAEPMYVILNLAVGGDGAGDPGPETEFPARFEIDYVRVYQDRDG